MLSLMKLELRVLMECVYRRSRLAVRPIPVVYKSSRRVWLNCSTAQEHVNEFYPPVEKSQSSFVDPPQSNQTRLMVKEPSLSINELLEKSSTNRESKFSLHPLPSAIWPKHSDLAPVPRHHGPHNKSKRGPKSEHLLELSTDKTRGEVGGLLPKPSLTASTAAAADRTAQTGIGTLQPTEAEGHPNSRPRNAPHPQPAPGPSPRRDPLNRRLDPEENRPGKAGLFHTGTAAAPPRNTSRPPVIFNRRSSSLLYQFDILRRESDLTHDAFCLNECRKEKDEKDYYCYTEFAVNGVVHDIDVVRKGIRLITLMVSSDGFYKMSRLYATPDSFFFKVRLLVLDTYKCSKPCPDIKLGTRYIVMGQIYHRRRHLPNDLLNLLGGQLKPGDGILRSNNYVKRFNKRKHQNVLEATRSKCR
ncbi:UPF0450 protein C17orf58 homolog isoform X2 [Syngnathoides biaculeatus]|uniref:UPF0450 protein C17orf58 homolog isoform X2 n=1 Tax=Syngnathoides biaculeatus TaxID=300417 RepID=UPI002ADD9078|nr:UPF0450 protein C17orf58 homolog isoform X2 [Syngnathoides biaculeatus]